LQQIPCLGPIVLNFPALAIAEPCLDSGRTGDGHSLFAKAVAIGSRQEAAGDEPPFLRRLSLRTIGAMAKRVADAQQFLRSSAARTVPPYWQTADPAAASAPRLPTRPLWPPSARLAGREQLDLSRLEAAAFRRRDSGPPAGLAASTMPALLRGRFIAYRRPGPRDSSAARGDSLLRASGVSLPTVYVADTAPGPQHRQPGGRGSPASRLCQPRRFDPVRIIDAIDSVSESPGVCWLLWQRVRRRLRTRRNYLALVRSREAHGAAAKLTGCGRRRLRFDLYSWEPASSRRCWTRWPAVVRLTARPVQLGEPRVRCWNPQETRSDQRIAAFGMASATAASEALQSRLSSGCCQCSALVTKVSASEPSQDQPQEDSLVSLANSDLSRIGPNYDQIFAQHWPPGSRPTLSKLNVQMPGAREASRRARADLRGTRSRLEAERVKVNARASQWSIRLIRTITGTPWLSRDLHAPGRQQWDQCESTSGQPIPGYFLSGLGATALLLSMSDRAPQLKLAENQLSVTGDKGYCMIRGDSRRAGTLRPLWWRCPKAPPRGLAGSAALGNFAGCDKFSYSWRSRKGTAFHDARGRHYTESGYRQGDVIGCLIVLQEPTQVTLDCLPPTHKSSQLIKFKNCLYYEERDEVQKQEKSLRLQLGSEIRFYRNGQPMGVAFGKLYANTYYPAISLYKAAQVQANFGPEFRYQPTDVADWLPMCQRVEEQAVEQCLAEIVDNLDGADRLDRMLTK
uniref:SPRY domain-containing protein n=1 Tax=Macrostomum lignano TaxID=282301 RepID=A0A1I8FCQ9_9PLAT